MEVTMYEKLRNEYFVLEERKEQLNRDIEKLVSAKREIEDVMDEIGSILTSYGTHVCENFIEGKADKEN